MTQAATEMFKQALNNPVHPLDCDLVFFGELRKDGKRAIRSVGRRDQWEQVNADAEAYTYLRAEDLVAKLGRISEYSSRPKNYSPFV